MTLTQNLISDNEQIFVQIPAGNFYGVERVLTLTSLRLFSIGDVPGH